MSNPETHNEPASQPPGEPQGAAAPYPPPPDYVPVSSAPGSTAGSTTGGASGKAGGRPEDQARRIDIEDETTRVLFGWWHDFRIAVGFLTILPMSPAAVDDHRAGLRFGTRAFPIAGLVVGLFGALVYAIASMLKLPPEAAAFIAIGAMTVFTGAIHEDGLADMADGIMARQGREQRLHIMRDSRIGTFGTLALIIAVGIKAGTITALGWPDQVAPMLIGCAAASRAVLPALMRFLPPARRDGLAFAAGRPEENQVVLAALLGAAFALLFLGPTAGLIAIVAGVAAAALVGWIARKRLGGVTGDVLGAAQQVTETAMMLAVVASF